MKRMPFALLHARPTHRQSLNQRLDSFAIETIRLDQALVPMPEARLAISTLTGNLCDTVREIFYDTKEALPAPQKDRSFRDEDTGVPICIGLANRTCLRPTP